MSIITLLDNEHVTLQYDTDCQIVFHTFHGAVSGKIFREVLELGAEVMYEKGGHKWLSDDHLHLHGLAPEDAQWTFDEWLPEVADVGWQYWALVVPDDFEGRASMLESVQVSVQYGVHTQLFPTQAEAWEWLQAC